MTLTLNTSGGGFIQETDFLEVKHSGHMDGVAVDIFESEPYKGHQREIERYPLTIPKWSMYVDCQMHMEFEAPEETVRFLHCQVQERKVQKEKYALRMEGY